MTAMVTAVLAYCEGVLRGDPEVLGQLRDNGFSCAEGYWEFSLPALHALLSSQLVVPADPGYSSFLKQLYASDINQRLAQQGAQIAIADNRGKVSESLYRLQRLP